MFYKPYVIRCNNKSAIDFTRNKIERSRTKISICHITKEIYENDLIDLKYILSSENVADIFTKSLSYVTMNKHIEKLNYNKFQSDQSEGFDR